MPTIMISHFSQLVSYLTAISIRLKYSNRFLRIVIVEPPEHKASRIPKPWCGISTISNSRIGNSSHVRELLREISQFLVFVDSLQIRQNHQRKSPDLPLHGTHFAGTIGDLAQNFAIIYHPDILVARMRQILLSYGSVTFLSPLQELSASFSYDTCIVAFSAGEVNNRRTNLQIGAVSLLCSASLDGRKAAPILWMPLFKAQVQLFDAIFTDTVARLSASSIRVDIHTINMNNLENMFASAYDLGHAIKAADYVLGLVDQYLNISPLHI